MRPSAAPRTRASRRGVLVALLGLGLLLQAGCSTQRASGPAGSQGELPDQEVRDFALSETDSGPLWKLYAKYAATYTARNLVVARSLRVDFYDDKGQRSSVLTANAGEINDRSRDMIARGNVVLETTDGTRMSTEEMRFLNDNRKIVVPETQLVRVQRQNDVLSGYGFESDPDLHHYEFKKKVQATVRSNTGGLLDPNGKK
jgi:LPS export ABC transporter protein LptC